MTLEEAFKQAIKNYWENDEEEEGSMSPKKYNKKYFKDREAEYLGDKVKEEEEDE